MRIFIGRDFRVVRQAPFKTLRTGTMNGFVGVPHKAILLFVIQKSQGVTEESGGRGETEQRYLRHQVEEL